MRPNDKVIVNCPKGEDYKAIVAKCTASKVLVEWVDNRTWKRLDPNVYKPEWKSKKLVAKFKTRTKRMHSTIDVDLSEDESPTWTEMDVEFWWKFVEDLKGERITFGCDQNGNYYNKNPQTFDAVSKNDDRFKTYAVQVANGIKPPWHGPNHEKAKLYVKFCEKKQELRNAVLYS